MKELKLQSPDSLTEIYKKISYVLKKIEKKIERGTLTPIDKYILESKKRFKKI